MQDALSTLLLSLRNGHKVMIEVVDVLLEESRLPSCFPLVQRNIVSRKVRNEMAVVTIEMADATGTPFKRGLSTE